ncbi:glycerate kinase [Anaerotaenia torta]|uniref:glycerate kinase family protein n=1 Tax=Anaerotaenia torta TaxID=433293 RepID=UPI003D1B0F76
MNILIVSDSFKGSLSSRQVAERISQGIRKVSTGAKIRSIPVADGGEGTVEAVIECLGGSYGYCDVVGPMGDKVKARYGILEDGAAIIEMAEASGITLVPRQQQNVLRATTYGTGQLIKDVLDKGCRNIYIGIGGSATNDGGVGMAQALGAHFLDSNGKEVGYGGGQLASIAEINLDHMDSRLKEARITVLSDVTNPLCGPTGAAAVYGPQKGASPEQVRLLDSGLQSLAQVIKETLDIEVKDIKGAGAAGGLGMGLLVFTGAKLQIGINTILELADFEKKLEWADLVITGEGRIDEQSLNGKVPIGISNYASKYGVPVIAIVGSIGRGAHEVFHHNIAAMESCVAAPCTLEQAMENSEQNLILAAERIMRSILLGIKLR